MKRYRNLTDGASTQRPIGALLRRPSQEARRRVHEDLLANGFEDIHPAHLNVLEHPDPRAIRPTDLARAAGMTKQAMNHLLRQLEALGYIERRSLPEERGTALWLTARGEAAVQLIRKSAQALEEEWREQVGGSRYKELRELLVHLNASLAPCTTIVPPADGSHRLPSYAPGTLSPPESTATPARPTAPPRSTTKPRAPTRSSPPPRASSRPPRATRSSAPPPRAPRIAAPPRTTRRPPTKGRPRSGP